MPTPPLLIDANNPNLRAEVTGLRPVPGYCIFIDIVGSTQMKQKGLLEWVALIHNGFANAATFLSSFPPLKGIGDELMYYIEEADLAASGYTAMQVFDGLYQMAKEGDASFPPVKIVAAYCTSVYPITFIAGARDYYGIDIDRAARLKGDSIKPSICEREVIIDEAMYQRIRESYNRAGNKDQFKGVPKLQGPTSHTAKGIPEPISIYRV